MKRYIIIFMLCAYYAALWAQDGLAINALFDGRFKQSPTATEILVDGGKARAIGLDIYRSLTVTDMAQAKAIEQNVTHDGARAKSKEVEYRGGRLYYGFYELGLVRPVKTEKQARYRYVFYLNQSLANKTPQNRVTLIYMESKHGPEKIKQLIKK